jgi:hypothetical protein
MAQALAVSDPASNALYRVSVYSKKHVGLSACRVASADHEIVVSASHADSAPSSGRRQTAHAVWMLG